MSTTIESSSSTISPTTVGASSERAAQPHQPSEWVHRLASLAHQGIDKAQTSLSATPALSGDGGLGVKASQAVDPVRERINAQPLKAAGAALATGLVFDKLFLRKSEARAIEEPAYVPDGQLERHRANARAQALLRAASDGVRRLGEASQYAVGAMGAAAAKGAHNAKAMSASISDTALRALPRGRRQLDARSQAYAAMARSSIQAHPLVGAGVALGVGALATSLLMPQRHRGGSAYASQGGASYRAVDKDGRAVGQEWDDGLHARGAGVMPTSRAVVSAGIALGAGVVLGAILARR